MGDLYFSGSSTFAGSSGVGLQRFWFEQYGRCYYYCYDDR